MSNTSDRSHQQQASNTRNSSSSNSYLPIEELTDVVNYDPTTNTLNLDLFSLLASDSRFGFSIQKQIYLEENGNFEYRGMSEFGAEFGRFCQRLGWDAAGWYGTSGDNRFSLQAPIGFMPSIAAETRGGAYYTVGLLSHSGLSIEDVFGVSHKHSTCET